VGRAFTGEDTDFRISQPAAAGSSQVGYTSRAFLPGEKQPLTSGYPVIGGGVLIIYSCECHVRAVCSRSLLCQDDESTVIRRRVAMGYCTIGFHERYCGGPITGKGCFKKTSTSAGN
jgi:hypothetical protein